MNSVGQKRPSLSKRKFLVMAGSFSAAVALGGGVNALAQPVKPVEWKGAALGAEASIQLYHSDPDWARLQLEKCQKEIDRLENLFSLYRPGSAIRRLNETGILDNPDVDFLSLLSTAKAFSQQSNGVFDVTVQPLWELFSRHFSVADADPRGPDATVVAAVLDLVGSRHVHLSSNRVRFDKPGMGVTFNGIAQGYVTDRVTDLLRKAGFDNVLVSLGESFALGEPQTGQSWQAGIVSPDDGTTIVRTLNLKNKALATSGGYGSPFSSRSDFNHLVHPQTAQCAKLKSSVSVVADTAVKADMVSTALSLMSKGQQNKLIASHSDVREVIFL